ncbi:putative Polycomb group protein ASXL2 isoform X2 [Branchiostoma lanceolatum]|uniref:putative Polycomb group protein ASXL2 isoform X2 n=1 Tax=Branchiostoma lanceolatum TaxID=7740 RepID=UPI0034558DA6
MREKSRKKKGRTWAEAAKMALEKYPKTPMSHKEILRIIQEEGLKEINGTTPLACLNAMLHSNSRGEESLFYKVAGKMGVYGLKSDLPEGVERFYQDDSEPESSQTDTSVSDGQGAPVRGKEKRKDELAAATAILNTPAAAAMRQHHEHSYTAVPGTSYQAGSSLSPSKVGSSHSKHHHHHSKRSLKHGHSMKHSHKRRKKGSKDIPRLILKPVTPPSETAGSSSQFPSFKEYTSASSTLSSLTASTQSQTSQAPTLTSLLSNLPGLSRKPRRRSQKKLPPAAPIDLTKSGNIDVETPDSIFVNTNLRALVNKHTFASLPPSYQYQLLLQLPECDRQIGGDGSVKLSSTALSNEFFTRACLDWKERLADGEFTPEMQLRLKQEEEKEKTKLDPWKEKHYEAFWGQNSPQSSPSKKQKPIPSTASLLQDLSIPTAGLLNTALAGHSYTSSLRSLTVAQSLMMAAQKPVSHVAEHTSSLSGANQMAATGSASASLAAIGQKALSSHKKPGSSNTRHHHSSGHDHKGSTHHKTASSSSSSASSQKAALSSQSQTLCPTETFSRTSMPGFSPGLDTTVLQSGAVAQGVSQQHGLYTEPQTKRKLEMVKQIVPEKRPKLTQPSIGAPQKPVSQPRTLSQIKAQTQAKVVGRPAQGQTRTLAQIKAQTAAKQQGGTKTLAQIKAQTQALRAANQQGRTRTLAEIKAQTKAKLQARTHTQMQGKLQAPVGAALHVSPTSPNRTGPTSSPGQPRVATPQLSTSAAGAAAHGIATVTEPKTSVPFSVPGGSMPLTHQVTDTSQTEAAHSGPADSRLSLPQTSQKAEESLSQQPLVDRSQRKNITLVELITGKPPDKVTSINTTDNSAPRPSTLEMLPQTSVSEAFNVKSSQFPAKLLEASSPADSISSSGSVSSERSVVSVHSLPPHGGSRTPRASKVSSHYLLSSSTQALKHQLRDNPGKGRSAARPQNPEEPPRAASAPPIPIKFCGVNEVENVRAASVASVPAVADIYENGQASCAVRGSGIIANDVSLAPVNRPASNNTAMLTHVQVAPTEAAPNFVNQHVGVPVSFVGFQNVVRLPQGALPQHIQVPQGMIQGMNQVHVGNVMHQVGQIVNVSPQTLSAPPQLHHPQQVLVSMSSNGNAIPITVNQVNLNHHQNNANSVVNCVQNANNVNAMQNAGGTPGGNPNCVGPNSNNSGGHGTTNAGSKCSCRLKAMVMCKSCGAFCHDDCIGPSRLCVTCLIK